MSRLRRAQRALLICAAFVFLSLAGLTVIEIIAQDDSRCARWRKVAQDDSRGDRIEETPRSVNDAVVGAFQTQFHGFHSNVSDSKFTNWERLQGENATQRFSTRSADNVNTGEHISYERVSNLIDSIGDPLGHADLNYVQAHKNRWVESVLLSAPFVSKMSRVLFIGDYGQMVLLFWKLFHIAGDAMETIVHLPSYSFGVDKYGYVISGVLSEAEYQFGPVSAKQCNIEAQNCNFTHGSFDVVIAFEVIEHMEKNPLRLIRAAYAALKPDGKLLLTTPNADSYINILKIIAHEHPSLYNAYTGCGEGSVQHVREYGINELQQLLIGGGFKVIKHRTISPYSRFHIRFDDEMTPTLRKLLILNGMVESMSGYTHFIVGSKNRNATLYKCVQFVYHDQVQM